MRQCVTLATRLNPFTKKAALAIDITSTATRYQRLIVLHACNGFPVLKHLPTTSMLTIP